MKRFILGKVDLPKLKLDLFNQIMKNAGMSDEEIASIPNEKRVAWDTKYAHMLAKGINESVDDDDEDGYIDILRASNLHDFDEYINDKSNKYGVANANTKKMFKKLNLNYENWVKPSKDLEINFVSIDKNQERFKQISAQIEEDMNTLMRTPVKGHIKKQFPDFVKGDTFVLPDSYRSNLQKMKDFVHELTDTEQNGKMSAVWNRAKANLNNSDANRVKTAQSTMTIYDHLKQRRDDLANMKLRNSEKSLDLKIKLWDRYPQKDLFQGNYSTCCIGVGNGNGSAMPHYLMNTAFNMIELVDNNSGHTIGNALCYFIKGQDGKPAFVIDNIEINNSQIPSDEVGIKLRSAVTEYASKLAQSVTGNDYTPIYMSGQYNDVPDNDLSQYNQQITFIGDMDCESIYFDLFGKAGEWVQKDELTQRCELLKLR